MIFRFFIALAVFIGSVMLIFFAFRAVLSRYTWYPEDPLYQYLKLIEANAVWLVILICSVGFIVIFSFYWRKTLGFIDAIVEASELLAKQEDGIIELPDELSQVEVRMNHVKQETLRNAALAKEAERRKNDFIVNIAHDLRTPLTSIIGYLSFISEKELSAELSAKYAAIAFEKSQQLESLIESLFDIAHLTADELPVHKEELNLKKLLLQKQDELYPLLHNADMEIRLFLSDSASKIHADGGLIARVFDNLINNAVRYSREGRFIDIETENTDDKLRISIITHANPVPADELDRIFDKLYRLEKSRSTATGGTGLGLSISRRIIELHGGTLTARQAKNGTAFDILLPS